MLPESDPRRPPVPPGRVHCSACGAPDPVMVPGPVPGTAFTDCCDEPRCAGVAAQRWEAGDERGRWVAFGACCAADAAGKAGGGSVRRIALW